MQVEKLTRPISRIGLCPIQEAIIEIRFQTDVPDDAILGLLYKSLTERYENYALLPITQIPKVARDIDGTFQYHPFYKFTNQDFIFQLGPRSFSLIAPKEYVGWHKFFDEFQVVFSLIEKVSLIKKIERIGIRYIDFFDKLNIFDRIQLTIKDKFNSLAKEDNYLKHSFIYENFNVIVQISNQASVQSPNNNKEKLGSVIDIDLSMDNFNRNPLIQEIFENIKSAHEIEKNIFFNLLKEDFLKELKPQYDD